MTSRETRRAFLDFFASRGHRVVPSSPLVLPDDPTLLFANAGMNQFKDVFTGRETRDYRRAASSQKCLRVSGKHNDLEMVGRTPRHHTFFEMLGNFSFGDYFKKDAIAFAWELVTGVYGIPEDRLWVTVFGGSPAAEPDEEAQAVWRDGIGVRPERILRLGEKDNFWRMGETGPCGPCSEIHFDLGEDLTSVPGPSTPATDERRFVEIWNLVFMQFEQHADGTVSPLPAPSIDTGMGLERVAAVLQGKRSNYDADLFQPILAAAADRAGVRYGSDAGADFSLRVIADHARALCFLVTDGVVPANDRRGYVLRRVLRRAIRHGVKLGIEGPFLQDVAPVVLETLGDVYPEIVAASNAILEIARREEERFADTVTAAMDLLDRSLKGLPEGSAELPGTELFRLYDTFGLPVDLAQDIADERGVRLDMEGFEREMERQRARAQASWKGGGKEEAAGIHRDLAARHRTSFEGYRTTRLEGATVVALLRGAEGARTLTEGEEGEVILDATPFYGEAGGQVGDTGRITTPSGSARVVDTQRPADGLIAHRVLVEAGELREGEPATAEVDEARRNAIRRNHTATHLLHAALREVVGTHVKQAGSRVAPDRLRFDFTHFAPVSDRALADIETTVNRRILEDLEVTAEVHDLEEAVRSGAMALFGEKYGDRVRVVRAGEYTVELCGGTHCSRTGQIGLFRLLQERGIASGTRRVEAVTGEGSLARLREAESVLRRLEEALGVPRSQVEEEIRKRAELARSLQKELDRVRLAAEREKVLRKADEERAKDGPRIVDARVDGLAGQETRILADEIRNRLGDDGFVILGRAEGGKATILVAASPVAASKVDVGDLVRREVSPIIGGGGGGKRDLAEAGGRDVARLDEAMRVARDAILRRVRSG